VDFRPSPSGAIKKCYQNARLQRHLTFLKLRVISFRFVLFFLAFHRMFVTHGVCVLRLQALTFGQTLLLSAGDKNIRGKQRKKKIGKTSVK